MRRLQNRSPELSPKTRDKKKECTVHDRAHIHGYIAEYNWEPECGNFDDYYLVTDVLILFYIGFV